MFDHINDISMSNSDETMNTFLNISNSHDTLSIQSSFAVRSPLHSRSPWTTMNTSPSSFFNNNNHNNINNHNYSNFAAKQSISPSYAITASPLGPSTLFNSPGAGLIQNGPSLGCANTTLMMDTLAAPLTNESAHNVLNQPSSNYLKTKLVFGNTTHANFKTYIFIFLSQ